jgi:hypothetical protein
MIHFYAPDTMEGTAMKKSEEAVAWVVYKMTVPGSKVVGNVVCEQSEWDAMEAARPGYHVLVQAGIHNEAEAERLARGTAGDRSSSSLKRL